MAEEVAYRLTHPAMWRPGVDYELGERGTFAEADCEAEDQTFRYAECPIGHSRALPRVSQVIATLNQDPMGQPLIWTRNGSFDILVNSSTRLAIEEKGLTGVEFVPAQIKPRVAGIASAPELDEYSELRIVEKAQLDLKASGYRPLPRKCPYCGYRQLAKSSDGLVLVHDSMLTDFCYVEEYPYWHLISKRAAEVFVEHQLGPCVIWRLDQLPFDAGESTVQRRLNDVVRLCRKGYRREEAVRLVEAEYGSNELPEHL